MLDLFHIFHTELLETIESYGHPMWTRGVRLGVMMIRTLTEFVQGPCKQNQVDWRGAAYPSLHLSSHFSCTADVDIFFKTRVLGGKQVTSIYLYASDQLHANNFSSKANKRTFDREGF